MLDEAAPVARFLGVLDLFVLWWCVVLAGGVDADPALYGEALREGLPLSLDAGR